MLILTKDEQAILDDLLKMSPKAVAVKNKVTAQAVYNAKHKLRAKSQNAREFLAVANSKYASLLSRRIKTPKIMQIDEEPLEIEKHSLAEESLCQQKRRR